MSLDGGRPSNLDSVSNFRDVGQVVNKFVGRPILRNKLLYRSARLDAITDTDRRRLKDEFSINTIVDLRSRTEHIEAARKRQESQSGLTTVVENDNTGLIHIPGTKTVPVNLNGKGFERHLVWQLSYFNLFKLIGLMGMGYRLEGIGILGKNVLQPRGLNGLAQDTIEHSQPEIKELFDALSTPDAFPALIHCTQGKDRTGLTILLLLLLCNVPIDAIAHDYALSESELQPEFAERMKEVASIGLDESFAHCAPGFAQTVGDYITSKYGDVVQYLLHIGVTNAQIESVRLVLLGDQASTVKHG